MKILQTGKETVNARIGSEQAELDKSILAVKADIGSALLDQKPVDALLARLAELQNKKQALIDSQDSGAKAAEAAEAKARAAEVKKTEAEIDRLGGLVDAELIKLALQAKSEIDRLDQFLAEVNNLIYHARSQDVSTYRVNRAGQLAAARDEYKGRLMRLWLAFPDLLRGAGLVKDVNRGY